MKYHYQVGASRWSRHSNKGDVRASRPPNGWSRFAHLLEAHPITNKPFKNGPQWWFRDVFNGDEP